MEYEVVGFNHPMMVQVVNPACTTNWFYVVDLWRTWNVEESTLKESSEFWLARHFSQYFGVSGGALPGNSTLVLVIASEVSLLKLDPWRQSMQPIHWALQQWVLHHIALGIPIGWVKWWCSISERRWQHRRVDWCGAGEAGATVLEEQWAIETLVKIWSMCAKYKHCGANLIGVSKREQSPGLGRGDGHHVGVINSWLLQQKFRGWKCLC